MGFLVACRYVVIHLEKNPYKKEKDFMMGVINSIQLVYIISIIFILENVPMSVGRAVINRRYRFHGRSLIFYELICVFLCEGW